jgi:hypothetical protein
MKNSITEYSKLSVWLLVIFIVGVLCAIGDISLLIRAATNNIDSLSSRMFFSVFQDKTMFFILKPLTLFCTIMFLLFMLKRRFFLFKLFFFASCLITFVHSSIAIISLYPTTIFDIWTSMSIGYSFVETIINFFFVEFFWLKNILSSQSLYIVGLIIGAVHYLGLLVVCFFYFKRSKQVAKYFELNINSHDRKGN